eukprot:9499959-Pyramimonas_sp.AAC.1
MEAKRKIRRPGGAKGGTKGGGGPPFPQPTLVPFSAGDSPQQSAVNSQQLAVNSQQLANR